MKKIMEVLLKLGYICSFGYSEKSIRSVLKLEELDIYIHVEKKAKGYSVEVAEVMKGIAREKKVTLDGYKEVIEYIKKI